MSIHSDNPEHGFQFPGVFEISAMGAVEGGLEAVLVQTLADLGLEVRTDTLRSRPSSKGNYVSVTVAFVAHSRDDYEAAHGALRAHPAVKWTL
jgi:hypothetical protein